eukprot:scaffold37889_cov66-Attheya_sp.AAC.1
MFLCILPVLFTETTMAVPVPSMGQKLSRDSHNKRSTEMLEKVPAQRELNVKASKSGKMGKSTSPMSPPMSPPTSPPTSPLTSPPTGTCLVDVLKFRITDSTCDTSVNTQDEF